LSAILLGPPRLGDIDEVVFVVRMLVALGLFVAAL
jgi:hypothetical protein